MKTLLVAIGLLAVSTLQAAEFAPAVVFDMGGKFDKSFNEAAYQGAERFKQDTGTEYREFEIKNPAQREQALQRLSDRGADPIVGIGFSQGPAIEKVAPEYPDIRFAIIDSVVDQPNVKSVVFKEHEGSFLVGVLAAMASETGKIGFVGGMDIPLIRKFACGYEQGAKHVNPDIEVYQNMTGTTPAAWSDPSKGAELARSQFDRGADIIFAAAGATGLGVLQAAADAGKYAIGVDSNQNHLHPGAMLTSMVKRVDQAVYNAFMEAKNGNWQSGIQALGLAEGGVDWALDEHNRDLVSEQMETQVNEIKQSIIDGEIQVHDYMADNSCEY